MKKSFFSLIYVFFFSSLLHAHPHMLLETALEFDYCGRECTGVWIEWGFDSMFSASIIDDYDKDGNGLFNTTETRAVHDNAFTNLRNYGYFVFLRVGNKRKHPDTVESFSVRQKSGRLFYRFFIPLKGQGYGEDFSIAIFDATYFCAVRYCEKPVTIKQERGEAPHFLLAENKKYPVYYDPFGAADDFQTYEKWKPGLETAYPEEVRVYF